MSEADRELIIVPPGGGVPVVRLNGEDTRLIAGAEESHGAYAIRSNEAPPRFSSVPLHIHRDAEEAFYVLEGELLVHARGQWLAAPAGAFVVVPSGMEHAIANARPLPVRWLTLVTPADRAGWVEAEHELIESSDGAPDPDRLAAIHRDFGLEITGPPPPLPADPSKPA